MFDADKRALRYPLANSLALSAVISEDEPDCGGSSSVIFPEDPDERTVIPFLLSLNEYNVLASAIDVGSDIAYGTDAIAVMYLWLRNTRCMDMICDWIQSCTIESIGKATGVDQYQRYTAIANAKQAQYETDWDGTPPSINPDAPVTDFDNGGGVEDTLALCSACEAYVKLFAAQKVQQLTIVYVGFAAIISFLALLAPGLGWILAAGIAVAIGGAILVGGVTYGAAINALNDVLALNDVACCMKEGLVGQTITAAHLNDSLNECDFEVGSNAEIARGFVAASFPDNFYTFIDTLGAARKAQADGEPVDCVCNHWESVMDFTVSDYGFVVNFGVGNYVADVGFEDEYVQVPSGNGYRIASYKLTLADSVTMDYAEITFEYEEGTIENSFDVTLEVGENPTPSLVEIFEPTIPVSPEVGMGSITVTEILMTLMCGVILGTGDPGGSCTITRLVLRGIGTKPPELP